MLLRALAIASGIALVAAAAYASLAHSGAGLTSPYGLLTLAVAGGLIVGALCVGAAWGAGRRAIALAIASGMICGELYTLILTSERILSTRDAARVSIQAVVERRQSAARLVRDAEARHAKADSSPRLERAITAKATADRAAIEKSAERSCASNCRALLQAQVDAAQREVDAALAARSEATAHAARVLEAARLELAALRPPPSASPLAARLGLPAWILDLIAAGLASLAINGLGAALLAFGAHGGARREPTKSRAPQFAQMPAAASQEPEMIAAPRDNLAHVAKFMVEAMRPDPEGMAAVREVRAAYIRWCRKMDLDALPAHAMADYLAALCRRAGLEVGSVDGRPIILGVKLLRQDA